MIRKLFIPFILLSALYLILLVLFHRDLFSFTLDSTLLDRYFLSQDIPHEVPGVRQFLSDEEIYLATGILYMRGEDPSQFNFEHPPLIKYLFGASYKWFGNPYYIQIIFGVAAIGLLLLVGTSLYSKPIAILATVGMIVDPLFLSLSNSLLLDMGQLVFLLLYTYSVFKKPRNYVLQGVALALFAGTKFWVTPLFFFCFIYGIWFIEETDKAQDDLVAITRKWNNICFVIYSIFHTHTGKIQSYLACIENLQIPTRA